MKEANMNLYYMNYGQAQDRSKKNSEERKKTKERQKRIKQNKETQKDDFDLNTETVIQMTNKNKIKKEIFIKNNVVIRNYNRWYRLCYDFSYF